MSVGVAQCINLLMDNDMKMEELLESAVLQEAIQTCVYFLPAFLFSPTPCITLKLWDLSDTKLKSMFSVCLCPVCSTGSVCVCCGASTSVLFSYCEPKKLFCLSDWMHMYSQLHYAIQIRHQRIPVINK